MINKYKLNLFVFYLRNRRYSLFKRIYINYLLGIKNY